MSVPKAEASGSTTVFHAVQGMLSASLHRSASDVGVSTFQNPRLNKAQRHILDHIDNPVRHADGLAKALCMSRRSLYVLFKERHLTPARMIHDTRVEQSLQVIGDPGQWHCKITDIAFDHELSDYATFSRLFKAQCGIKHGEYRLDARVPKA